MNPALWNITCVALGAVILAIGQWQGARRALRERAPRTPRIDRGVRAEHGNRRAIQVVTDATSALERDVIAALTQLGFARDESTECAQACAGSERSTLDSWVRAALKHTTALSSARAARKLREAVS
jgi:hypothetical protein